MCVDKAANSLFIETFLTSCFEDLYNEGGRPWK